jgi:hypothetical protein
MPAVLLSLALQVLSEDEAVILLPGAVSLLLEGSWLSEEERAEGVGDALLILALLLPPGEERRSGSRRAHAIYAPLMAILNLKGRFNDSQHRKLWKRIRARAEFEPESLEDFFRIADRRGYAPKWDEDDGGSSPWGWKARFERLRPGTDQVLIN